MRRALHYGSTTHRYSFNPAYGFGVVDASAAVNAALAWQRLPELVTSVVKSSGPEYDDSHRWDPPDEWDATIPSDGVTKELTLQAPSDIDFLEHVGVSLYLTSSHGRDLRIELVSPDGTTSMLVDAIESRAHCGNSGWKAHNWCELNSKQLKLASSEFLGEDPNGTWTLRITDPLTDASDGYSNTTLYSWQLHLLGHQGDSSDTVPRARLRVNNANDISVSVNEGSTVRVTASLTGGTLSQDVVIPVSLESGTATPPSGSHADYSTSGPLQVRIRAGQSSGSATFRIASDSLSEYDETLTVKWPDPHGASAPSSVLLLGDPVEVTISGDLAPPGPPRTVTLEAVPATVSEGSTAQITARLDGGPWSQGIRLPVSFGQGTATGPGPHSGRDHHPLQQNGKHVTHLTIPAGATSATLQLVTIEDDNWSGKEPPETVSVVVHRPASLRNEVAVVGSPVNITIVEAAVAQPPVVGVTAGVGVTESGSATFTLTASPAPTTALTVDVSVAQQGDFGVTTGSRQVTISTSGTASLTVATTDDSVDEADGSITVTVDAGQGYTVSGSADTATVAVADDDDPPPAVDACVTALAGSGSVDGEWDSSCASVDRDGRYARFYTFGLDSQASVTIDLTSAVDTYLYLRSGLGNKTAAELDKDDDGGDGYNSRITRTLAAGDYTIEATTYAASRAGEFQLAVAGVPAQTVVESDPEVSIAAGGDITEGGNATFTVTADPAPAAALDVSVSVAQSGDFGVTAGSHTVTVSTTGTGTLTVATTDDSVDEPDGSVSVTVAVDDGNGYTVSTTAGSASAAVTDDDPPATRLPPSQVSFSAEDASAIEGDTLRFRIMLSDAADARVRVYWRTRYSYAGEHSAFPNVDYPSRARGWIAFEPGDTEKWVDIALPDDTVTEPDEVFQIYLSFTEGGATIADRDATMTIHDND